MSRARPVAIGVGALLCGAVVQTGLLAGLPLPGATPDLVLVLVAALGIAYGSTGGAVAGFGGGLLLDLAPPADHAVGQGALVLTLVGYAAGQVGRTRLAPTGRALIVGLVATLATLAALATSALLGTPSRPVDEVATVAVTAGGYAALLAVGLVPLVGWLAERGPVQSRTVW